ncbi:FAD/NAD(P)-binding domain-containing protein [Rhizoclosmatium globosum]|uniref:FAD/NAD(P)-binding domain-containing protein n=1 Tax=Rhizoclosmatium globosum TaxID=329046 RepID=A0A1Y2CTP0_9FUNG|nr:FAD/NAD(P)-binding domain-containing protein [Rhizoclosmatium globosum]|eukprot:ORY50393.1 FAD/NAD(P)-binding domain-containing protein [Rhizoclosmatium globosum]
MSTEHEDTAYNRSTSASSDLTAHREGSESSFTLGNGGESDVTLTNKRIAIIGCGLAGVVTAIALKKQGFEPTLFDKVIPPRPKPQQEPNESNYDGAVHFGEVGGGVGMDVITREIQANHPDYIPPLHVMRSDLHGALMEEAHALGIKVRTGKKIVNLEQHEDSVTVYFDDGDSITSDLVIGADGIHSVTRRLIFPDSPKPVVCGTGWLGVLQRGVAADGTLVDFDQSIGIYANPLNGTSVFQVRSGKNYATFAVTERNIATPQKVVIMRIGARLDSPNVVNCIQHAQRITRVSLYYLPDLPILHSGRVVLVGDAAHGTLPTYGQGLNQAFEDAGTIGALFSHFRGDYSQIYKVYNQVRLDRVHKINGLSQKMWNRQRHRGLGQCT